MASNEIVFEVTDCEDCTGNGKVISATIRSVNSGRSRHIWMPCVPCKGTGKKLQVHGDGVDVNTN